MLKWWKSRVSETQQADRVYEAVVAQARQPLFYSELGVPDTMEGRYELIVLHMVLLLERLRDSGSESDVVARLTLERFVEDMDDCMREIGVGDMSVAKRVKAAAGGLYERAAKLRPMMAAGDPAARLELAEHMARTVMDASDPHELFTGAKKAATAQSETEKPARSTVGIDNRAIALAAYARSAAAALADLPVEKVQQGEFHFPTPHLGAASQPNT